MKLLVATRNTGKLAELRRMLSAHELVGLPDDAPEVDETGATFEDNAILKAKAYAEHTGLPTLADDSGLEVDALDGAPGVHSARYAGTHGDDAANNRKLVEALKGVPDEQRGGRFVCALAFFDPSDGTTHVVRGAIEGTLLHAVRGEGGFGYDPLFLPIGETRTTAEMPASDKNQISHRAKAVAEMTSWIEART
ncbi:MAG: RdgB/HAM1 family non-canonical purine NTP pyrophosphatase [Sandaracinaceae bacterium]